MEKLNVLLVTGLLTAEHQGRLITRRLQELLEATGRFHVSIVEEFRNVTPAFLEPYDAHGQGPQVRRAVRGSSL